MSHYDTVATLGDLRTLDDSLSPHMRACLVENVSWFLLDRTSTAADDGKAVFSCLSGLGRWVIMTPQTAGLVAAAKSEE